MKVNHNRKIISTEQEGAYFEDLNLKELMIRVSDLINRYGEDATVEWYTPEYEDRRYLYVYKGIPETDEQMSARIAKEEEWAAQRKEYDRKEYERLSKIYKEST